MSELDFSHVKNLEEFDKEILETYRRYGYDDLQMKPMEEEPC